MNIAAKLPQAQDECGKITYGLVEKLDEMQAVGKVDYQRSTQSFHLRTIPGDDVRSACRRSLLRTTS